MVLSNFVSYSIFFYGASISLIIFIFSAFATETFARVTAIVSSQRVRMSAIWRYLNSILIEESNLNDYNRSTLQFSIDLDKLQEDQPVVLLYQDLDPQ